MLTKANEIYNLLIENQITKNQGDITFDFLDISIKINEKSAVGDLFQEWLAEWMRKQGIKFRIKQNSQEFPDFLLDEDSNIKDLLEIKTFYSSPNFDVANFEAHCDSLTKQAYRLDADYLIFSYDITHIPHPPVSQSVFSDFYPHLMLYFVPKPRNIGRR